MMLSALTTLMISIFLGPWFIKKLYELKIGQSIRTDECPLLGQLHHKKKDTPTMGGLLILASILISMGLWMDLKHPFTLLLLVTTVSLGFLGGRDDYLKLKYKNARGLSARGKLFFQLVLSFFIVTYILSPHLASSFQQGKWFNPILIKDPPSVKVEKQPQDHENNESSAIALNLYGSRLYIPFYKDPVIQFTGLGVILIGLLMMLVITGASNAVNLTDGLDGLAAGCLIMVASCLAFIAFLSNNVDLAHYLNIVYIEGSGEVAIYLSAFIGACLGFLWYNSYPAQVFMGDTGSLALGGVIGVSSVLLKRELLLGIIGGVFVVEALSVIIQVMSFKFRKKKRVFLCAPLHHHFEYKGWPETKVVMRFWIVSLLLAIVGLASLKFQ